MNILKLGKRDKLKFFRERKLQRINGVYILKRLSPKKFKRSKILWEDVSSTRTLEFVSREEMLERFLVGKKSMLIEDLE